MFFGTGDPFVLVLLPIDMQVVLQLLPGNLEIPAVAVCGEVILARCKMVASIILAGSAKAVAAEIEILEAFAPKFDAALENDFFKQ